MNRKVVFFLMMAGMICSASFILAAGSVALTNPISASNFPELLKSITTVVASLIGGLATIMIIIAGFFFLTSAGIPSRVETGKKALFFAIMGIVIALIAGPIVNQILDILK